MGMEVTVYGASRNLHSGHYGNWAPDTGNILARLLSSMKDDTGRVLIEAEQTAFENGAEVHHRTWRRKIPRRWV